MPVIYVLLFLNGQSVDFGAFKPMFYSGVVRVPLRIFSEKMGATVKYESYRHQAIVKYKDKTIIFPDNSSQAVVDGKTIEIGPTMIQTDSARYVPVRFLAKEMDMTVSFDQATKRVDVQIQELK